MFEWLAYKANTREEFWTAVLIATKLGYKLKRNSGFSPHPKHYPWIVLISLIRKRISWGGWHECNHNIPYYCYIEEPLTSRQQLLTDLTFHSLVGDISDEV